jgi:hypothetical protein
MSSKDAQRQDLTMIESKNISNIQYQHAFSC